MITPQGRAPITERCNEVHIKVDDFPIDVPIRFFRAVIATGSHTSEFVQKTGLDFSMNPGNLPDMMSDRNTNSSMIPVRRRVRNNFLVFCPDLPVLDMPILVDPDGIVIKREDFEGHYLIMYHPRNDTDDSIKKGDEKVDWELWHQEIKPRLIHRVPGKYTGKQI